MTWTLSRNGRVLARGTRADVIDRGEELRLIRVDTYGHDTAEPVHVPRIVAAGVVVMVEGRPL